jgi:TRAP-type C4-dicarboxylate transport system substrate-binding protein
MKEKRFFQVGWLAILITIALVWAMAPATPALSETINLTYANFPPPSTVPCVQMERWAKEVNARSDGKVKVKTFPGGSLLGAKSMFDGVVKGVADIGCLATAYQPGRFKLFQAMDLPVDFPNAEVASQVMLDLYKKHNPESFEGVKVLTMFTCSPADIMSMDPVKNLEDLKGMKLRAAGTGVKIMNLLGAAPEGMPMPAVPEALQKGVVKGLVTSVEVLKDMKFADYCKNVTLTHLWVVPFAVVMNQKKWDGLPEDVKKIFEDLAVEQAKWTGAYWDKHCKEALDWAQKEQDVKVWNLPDEQKKKWMDKLTPLKEEYVKNMKDAGLPGEEFLKDLMAFKEKYSK